MEEDFELLKRQLETNSNRIKKLEEHKKSVEPELRNSKSKKDNERLQETIKRIERNLKIEYEQRDRLTEAIKIYDKS